MFGKISERFRSFLGVGEGADGEKSRRPKRQLERSVENEKIFYSPCKKAKLIDSQAEGNVEKGLAGNPITRLFGGIAQQIKTSPGVSYLRNLGASPKQLMKKLTEIGGPSARQMDELPATSSASQFQPPEMKGMPLAHSTPHVRAGSGFNFSGVPCDLSHRDFQFQKQQEPVRFRAPPVSRAQNGPLSSQRPYGSTRPYQQVNITPGSRQATTTAKSIYDKTFRSRHSRTQKSRLASKESVRMEEKLRYAQLIQHFTSTPVASLGMYTGISRLPSAKQAASGLSETVLGSSVHANSAVYQKPSPPSGSSAVHIKVAARHPVLPERSFTELYSKQTGTSSVTGQKDLTMPPPVTKDTQGMVPSHRTGRDSPEIIRVEAPKLPARSPVSLEFDASVQEADWIGDLLQNCSADARKVNRHVKEEEVKCKLYKEQREEWEKQLEKRIRTKLILSERLPVVIQEDYEEEDEKEDYEEFPELTEEQQAVIEDALRPRPSHEVLVEGFRLKLTRQDLNTLKNLNWLNDEVINFYMNLLMDRGQNDNFEKVHAFNTFFYPKLINSGHSGVKRWTKKVDIFSARFILIPVHLGMHWCLAVVDFKKKTINYYDSMGGSNNNCLSKIRQYLIAEKLEKTGENFPMDDWDLKNVKDIPQQMNGSDCGMFTCKFAEYITRNADITFTQEHMPYFRKRIVLEIVTKTLL